MVTLAAIVAGCSGPSRPEPLTRRKLTDQANAICRRANDQIATLSTPDALDSAASATAFTRVVREQRAAYTALGSLVPPETDATAYARWLTQIESTLDLADESIDAISRDDPQAAITANQSAEVIRVDADAFAVSYGLTDCAQPAG